MPCRPRILTTDNLERAPTCTLTAVPLRPVILLISRYFTARGIIQDLAGGGQENEFPGLFGNPRGNATACDGSLTRQTAQVRGRGGGRRGHTPWRHPAAHWDTARRGHARKPACALVRPHPTAHPLPTPPSQRPAHLNTASMPMRSCSQGSWGSASLLRAYTPLYAATSSRRWPASSSQSNWWWGDKGQGAGVRSPLIQHARWQVARAQLLQSEWRWGGGVVGWW